MSRKKYDIAVSYAGEKRSYVNKVVEKLEDLGLKVFYDGKEECKIDLWGADLTLSLDNIYRKGSRYCIIFICKEYVTKPWTKYEFTVLRARNIHESDVTVLPARFDNSELPGLHSTFSYIDISNVSPEDFAMLAYFKIKGSKSFDMNNFYVLHSKKKYLEASCYLENLFTKHYEKIHTKKRILLSYNLACAYSRLASTTSKKDHVSRSFHYLNVWIENIARLSDKEIADSVDYLNYDDDLLYLRKKHKKAIQSLMKKFKSDFVPNTKASGGGGCFPKGTMVKTAFGAVEISELKRGDNILSYDLEANATIVTVVCKTYVSDTNDLVRINSTFCSPEQRFYVHEYGWLHAKDILIGMSLINEENQHVLVDSVIIVNEPSLVYNVETNHPSHNYFANGLLAHNLKRI